MTLFGDKPRQISRSSMSSLEASIEPADTEKAKSQRPFPIVGVGASAGGLPAFSELLSHLPQDPGLALVFIQHMDPAHVSQLPLLLSKVSRMPVLEVKDGIRVEKNHVYVIPPNADLHFSEGVLQLKGIHRERKPPFHLPIDTFFESLAKDQKERAVGVILSGTGHDGSAGAVAIKAAGGRVFVQDDFSAQYPDMPKAAMEAAPIDGALPCEDIARELVRGAFLSLHASSKDSNHETDPFRSGNEDRYLSIIFDIVREATGTDFSRYKPTTIQRRILRRMATHKVATLSDYVDVLQKDKQEAIALHQEMLINVTGFFRDPEVFELLKEKVMPEILKADASKSSVRIWVPACSTGEEVYSLAIVLLESLGGKDFTGSVQLFGSDISESVLEKARAGVYSEDDVAGVSPERLERFFVKVNEHYQIVKAIRELCVFAKQDLTRNPPFSRMDLISCRNLLIYLSLHLQNKVFAIFHYALNPGGFLMLGTAETVGNLTDLFAVVDKRGRIYSRKSVSPKLPFDVLGSPQWGKQDYRVSSSPLWDKFDLEKEANRLMIEKFAPPGLIVNEDMTIMRFQGRMRPYLDPTAGGASLHLMKMVSESLVTDLRILMDEVMKENRPVEKKAIPFLHNGKTTLITLEAIPLRHVGVKERYFSVLFREEKHKSPDKGEEGDVIESVLTSEGRDHQLVKELELTKRQLQSMLETEEATHQELRAANEEILSSNEELQSTNEELETSKEELQSTNEELSTVNDELRNRNFQLAEANADLSNLFASVDLPIIMLNSDLRIRHFTAMSEQVMHLKPGDEGRLISDFKPNVDVPDLEALVLECMKTGKRKEMEVKDRNGIWYLLQIRSYRTADGNIAGTIIAINIHQLKMVQEKLAESNQFLETIIQTVLNPIIVLDVEFRVVLANDSFYETFKVAKEETVRQSIYSLGNGQWNIPKLKSLLQVELPQKRRFSNYEIDHVFPHIGRRILLLNASAVVMKEQGPLILLSMQDVTKQREDALNLELQYEVMKVLGDSSDFSGASELVLRALCKRFGWQAGQLWLIEADELAPAFFWSDSAVPCPPLQTVDGQKKYKLKKDASEELDKGFYDEQAAFAASCGFQIPFISLIRYGNKIFGAFELFSEKPLKIEKGLLRLTEVLGSQIGQFIESKGVEKMKRTSEEVLRSSKLRQRFAAMTSHELRTPLTSIKEGINLVLEEFSGPLNEEQKENLRISQNNVDRLGGLINNLLDLTRIDSDTFKVFLRRTELTALLREVEASMKQMVSMKGISFSCQTPPSPIFAVCDAERLRQVLVNLIDNASKFTPKGGKITAQLGHEKGQILIQVSDTGTGIRKEDQGKIFELYAQSLHGEKKSTGFGIGLAICKNIMEQHHGQITVRSICGEGSQFTASFPDNLSPAKQDAS